MDTNDSMHSGDGRGYFTEERIMIRETARQFTMKEVLPVEKRVSSFCGVSDVPTETYHIVCLT